MRTGWALSGGETGPRGAGPGELLGPRGREEEEVAGWAGAEVWASREGVGRAGWVVGLV